MFGSLSIQARFLLSPIIGVVLTLVIYLMSNEVIKSHSQLFQDLSETNLVQISEISQVIILLSESNSEIISLLLSSESFDEEQVYVEGKKQLNELHRIEKRLNKSISKKDSLMIDEQDIFEQIRMSFSEYRYEAISAIEMSSVDLKQASYELVLANTKLKTLNALFLKLSRYYSDELTHQAKLVKGTLHKKNYLTEIAITLMALMLWSAFYFSKKTSAGLTQVYTALMNLTKGDTRIEVHHNNDVYIKNIWTAVLGFKDSIEKSEAYKHDLLIQKFAMDQHAIIATTDIKGIITYANSKFCEISGYNAGELLGKNHRVLNSGNQPQDYWRDMYLQVSKGKVWHDEVLNKRKNGELYWVDTTIIPVTSDKEHEKVTGYISIRTDITEQKNQQKKLIDANEIAESAVAAKSQFLATMSHEIRTPMNGVLGMLDLMLKEKLDEKQKERADIAQESAKSLLFLINDILDFSKIDAGKLELECVEFNLCTMLDDFAAIMRFQAQEKGLRLKLETASIDRPLVAGDPGRLRQILTNIVGNAIKFSEQGDITIQTDVESICDKKLRFNCSITDTGVGIPADRINSLFDSFSQVDASTTRRYGGTGLGLAISKSLVELMGGSISITSELGQGSCFSFSIALKKSEQVIEKTTPEDGSLKELSIPKWPKKTRLLLVEDNVVNQLVAQGTLEPLGLQAEIVENGLLALSKLKEASQDEPFTLVLMDCQMPVMDGYEASRRIRENEAGENNCDIPIIAMTANAMSGDREKCLQAGMSDYLTKPINPNSLLEKLRLWLLK